jgi:5-methylcytosine-specific restriction endonuclease McrA
MNVLRWHVVIDRCFVFNNLRYNLAAALVPPCHLSNDTDHGTGAVPFKAEAMKRCSLCKQVKPYSEFYKNKSKKDGYDTACKPCRVIRGKAWRENNPEKIKESRRRNTASEGFKSYYRRWYQSHKDWMLDYNRKWVDQNRDKKLAREANRRSREASVGGSVTGTEWAELKRKYNHACLCCGKREPEIKLTMDHVKPLIKGGANTIDNIQPLCQSCNSSKARKHIDYRG